MTPWTLFDTLAVIGALFVFFVLLAFLLWAVGSRPRIIRREVQPDPQPQPLPPPRIAVPLPNQPRRVEIVDGKII
jgi:hypothetical protein